MDNDTTKMEKILFALKEKYKQTDNLMTLTKELEKVLETDDPESFGVVLSMRQGSMNSIDKLNSDITDVLTKSAGPFREKILNLLGTEEEQSEFESPLEKGIHETNRMTLTLLHKIVKLDDEINKKVRGG